MSSLTSFISLVVAVKQRYKLKSNSQLGYDINNIRDSCCCKAKIQT